MKHPLLVIIFCGGAIMGLSLGFRQTFGLFLTPISIERGFGRESFALGMGLMNLVWGLASPFTGAVADRFGSARVIALGAIFYAVGLVAMTLSGQGNQLILAGFLIGLGLSGVGFSVILGTVGRAAPPEKQSAALGLVSMAGSMGQFAALPYTHILIAEFGWYHSLFALALTTLLILPLAAGIAGKTAASKIPKNQTPQEALGEVMANRSFWLLNAGFFACGFQLAFIAIHFPSFLADKGFDSGLGAAALALLAFCNIIGSYAWGALGARYAKKNLLSLLYLTRALIVVLFLAAPISTASVLLFSGAMGFLWLGTVPLTSGLVAYIFGTPYMSMIFGLVFLGHQVGGFLGAWLAGYVFDLSGSYDPIWWLTIGLGLISAALHWPIAERPLARLAVAGSTP